LEHHDKLSPWSAFNSPIEEGNFFKLNTLTNQALGVHSIGQYMKVLFQIGTPQQIKPLDAFN
jgi:hypothetical protein